MHIGSVSDPINEVWQTYQNATSHNTVALNASTHNVYVKDFPCRAFFNEYIQCSQLCSQLDSLCIPVEGSDWTSLAMTSTGDLCMVVMPQYINTSICKHFNHNSCVLI